MRSWMKTSLLSYILGNNRFICGLHWHQHEQQKRRKHGAQWFSRKQRHYQDNASVCSVLQTKGKPVLHFQNCICSSRWSCRRKEMVKVFFGSLRQTHWGLCLCPGGGVWRVCLHEHSAWHHPTAKEWAPTCRSWSPRCRLHLQVMPDVTQSNTWKQKEELLEANWHALMRFRVFCLIRKAAQCYCQGKPCWNEASPSPEEKTFPRHSSQSNTLRWRLIPRRNTSTWSWMSTICPPLKALTESSQTHHCCCGEIKPQVFLA